MENKIVIEQENLANRTEYGQVLQVLHQNVQCIKKKICVTEHWLKEHEEEHKKHGGPCIFFKTFISSKNTQNVT